MLRGCEIAELLRPKQRTIQSWTDPGGLQAGRVGPRRLRVRRSDRNDYLATSTTGGPSGREAGADHAERVSTLEALAGLRAQVEDAVAEDDLASLADPLASISGTAWTTADRHREST